MGHSQGLDEGARGKKLPRTKVGISNVGGHDSPGDRSVSLVLQEDLHDEASRVPSDILVDQPFRGRVEVSEPVQDVP